MKGIKDKTVYIDNIRLPGSTEFSALLIRRGIISTVTPQSSADLKQDTVYADGGGRLVTPGLINMHVHGIRTFHFDRSPEDLLQGAKYFPAYGTTTIFPTLVPDISNKIFLTHLENTARTLDSIRTLNIPGLHLEGPFVKEGGAACTPSPGDTGLLQEILEAGRGRIAAMSISPDTENILPVIKKLRDENITVFMTHTRANWEETTLALDAGVYHATHFYNVFYPPPEIERGCRPAGALEAILADPRGSADFICDGIHVHPGVIKAFVASKGYARTALITDASIGSGLPPGTYDTPWGFSVSVSPESGARNADPASTKYGRLAGSCLTMNRGITNLFRWLDIPEQEIWAMGSQVPAQILGLSKRGRLRNGYLADLVLWDWEENEYQAAATLVEGQCVFQKQGIDIFEHKEHTK